MTETIAADVKTEEPIGYIYFLRHGTRRIVKIGFSREHPRTRVSKLQTGSPERLFLIGMAAGTRADEKHWHRRFEHLRVRGEWFQWTPELRETAKPHLMDQFGRTARKLEAEIARLSPKSMEKM